jgi:hypothetical protein
MRTWLASGLIVFATFLTASQPIPRFTSVDPDTAKKGDAVVGKGENLSKTVVAEVLLTDGKKDTNAAISSQSESEIKFTIPDVTPGRYHVLVLSADHSAIIEQPVIVTVQ